MPYINKIEAIVQSESWNSKCLSAAHRHTPILSRLHVLTSNAGHVTIALALSWALIAKLGTDRVICMHAWSWRRWSL